MNAQTSIVRRLLPLALACGLFAALAPAAHAQLAAEGRTFVRNDAQLQPSAKDKAAGATAAASNLTCTDLFIVINGSSASVAKVTCEHGYHGGTVPESRVIAAGKPAVVVLQQSAAYGPDCTITISGGGNTAVLSAQQNFCALKAGKITASVTSGRATLNGSAEGSYGSNLPGLVWFNLGF
jgi:hypothetical protein